VTKDIETQEETNGIRILLVEDNAEHAFVALTVARQVLGDCIELIHAQNADEAVELLDHFTDDDRPDLFLIDLRLPNDGGFSVLSSIKAHPACAQVPSVVVTSSGYDRDIAECYQLGASAVLSKPLSRARFREELARLGMVSQVAKAAYSTVRH
jgi:CheY-like chemotaxis protein